MRICPGLFLAVACVATVSVSAGRLEEEETAVLSKVFNDYTREPSGLGGYKAETFAFANGGALLAHMSDPTVDKATFEQVIRLISPALTRQNYIAATDPADTDLLIYVSWGATDGWHNPAGVTNSMLQQTVDPGTDWYGDASLMDMANRRRDGRNLRNAALLGYREAILNHSDMRGYSVHGTIYEDLIGDVEESRYFVILVAYDFRTAWDSKQLVPLWSTRYNIRARGNDFTTALPDMSMFASRFFGRDSHGLIRRLNPTGKVEMGDVQILGQAETPAQEK